MALILLNLVVWIVIQSVGSMPAMGQSLCLYGLIPADLLGKVVPGSQIPIAPGLACVLDGKSEPFTLLSSMFLHGGWFHLIGNMWFLWVFGDNIEDAMGSMRFLLFYLVCGFAAAFAQIASNLNSPIPMVGASGAIGGVMGVYAILYPKVRVRVLLILGFYITTLGIPAVYMLGYWFIVQVIGGLPSFAGVGATGGTAFWAHVGGFVAGLALALPLASSENLEAQRRARRQIKVRHRW